MSRMGRFYFKNVEYAGLNNFIVNRSQKQPTDGGSVVCDSVRWASMSGLKSQNYQIDKQKQPKSTIGSD